ncbi:hypothetical protein KNO81_41075 [Paraburkholderia sediminicola]|nr:hypothetical protein [Paraburkholderia sediminicola]
MPGRPVCDDPGADFDPAAEQFEPVETVLAAHHRLILRRVDETPPCRRSCSTRRDVVAADALVDKHVLRLDPVGLRVLMLARHQLAVGGRDPSVVQLPLARARHAARRIGDDQQRLLHWRQAFEPATDETRLRVRFFASEGVGRHRTLLQFAAR